MRVTLTNDFHGTSVEINFPKRMARYEMSKSTTRRVQKALCGIPECKCSCYLGMRGRQPRIVIDGLEYVPFDDTDHSSFIYEGRAALSLEMGE